MIARQRNVPMQAAQAAIDGAARADASRRMADQARADAQAVNGMIGAINAQRRAGQNVLPRREYPPIPAEVEDNSFFTDWRPAGEPSFSEITHMLRAKLDKGELSQQTYTQVVKVVKDAMRGDAKSMAALAKGFHAGTAGFPVSLPWYYVCFTEACRLHGIQGFESENELPDFLRSLAVAQWPPEAVQAFIASGKEHILERRRGRPLIRSGCWIMEMRNQGIAPIIYKTVLYEDHWALGHTGIGKGPATQIVERQLKQLEGSLNFANMAFAQQLRQLLQFAFEGQWAYIPGPRRSFRLSIRLSNLGENQFESQSDFEFVVLGWRQNEKNGGYTLHAQEKSTGEWFLQYLPEHDAAPNEFLESKSQNNGIGQGGNSRKILIVLLLFAVGCFGAFMLFKLWLVWQLIDQFMQILLGGGVPGRY
jgi:hypothetical protein